MKTKRNSVIDAGGLSTERNWRAVVPSMARAAVISMALVAGATATVVTPGMVAAQTAAKSLEGHVLDGAGTPLPGAIVYLQDEKTNVIKTFISTKDGSYRFGQLPPDTDYQFWAEYKGDKSKRRTISSFDTKLDVSYDFHLKGN